MSKIIINNPLGADIQIESECKICGKKHSYRLKERPICSDDKCWEESKRRRDRKMNGADRR